MSEQERRRAAVRATALLAHKLGLGALPVTKDGKKTPGDGTWPMPWTDFQTTLPTEKQHQTWFGDERQDGVCLVTGPVSNFLVGFEFDAGGEVFQAFVDTAESLGFDFVADIRRGYEERSPNDGLHWLIYVPGLDEGNLQLACRPKLPHEMRHERDTVQVLMETRNRGGILVIAPSGGPVHPTGKPYTLVRGSLKTIHTITLEQYHLLCDLARSFDQMPDQEAPPADSPARSIVIDGLRPGDDFNQRTRWDELIEPYGWQVVKRRSTPHGEMLYVVRPGKQPRDGHSATINVYGSDLLKVFTSSTALEPGRTYDRFGFYAAVEHGGDIRAAAKALRAQGYGTESRKSPEPVIEIPPSDPGPDGGGTGPGEKVRYTDYGNAQRLVKKAAGALRYCKKWGEWLAFDGVRWSADDRGLVMQTAKASVLDLYQLADKVSNDERKTLIKHALASESDRALRAAVNLASTEPGIPIHPDEFDRSKMLLNVKNGTLDLRTGELRAHALEDYITRLAPVEFDSQATCPTWEAFLAQIFEGDVELIEFIQIALGYALTGDTSERTVFIAWGGGKNGKTTLASVVKEILGDYAQRTPTETLMLKRGDSGVPNDVARLKGARFVTASETEEGRRLNVSKIKDLAGNDTISARFMRGEWFDFRPEFKLWISTNHKPILPGHDQAIFDRIRLIPFTYRIPDGRVDKHLESKILAEAPGILNWLLQGCRQWQAHGLPKPSKVMEATQAYQQEMDQIGRFLEECCLIKADVKTASKLLYETYTRWCEQNGEKDVLTNAWFGRKLAERGFEGKLEGPTRARTWQGIGVLDDKSEFPGGERQMSGTSGTSHINGKSHDIREGNREMPLYAAQGTNAAHPSQGKDPLISAESAGEDF